MADKSEDQKSSIPGLSSVTDTAGAGVGKAQEGIAAGGSGVQTVTGNIPVVGKVTEGVGNAPVAQKIAGKDPEAEQKGYLQGAYEYASGAGKVVYDAAGNVIGTLGEYLPKGESTEAGEKGTKEKESASDGQGGDNSSYLSQAQQAVLPSRETKDAATEKASQASSTYNEATDQAKQAHRDVEDTAQKGVQDVINTGQEKAGTKDDPSSSTNQAAKGTNDAVDAAKKSTREVEDTTQKKVGDIGETVTGSGKDGESKGYSEKASDVAGSVGSGGQEAVGSAGRGAAGAAEGVKDTGVGVGKGVTDGVGKVGSGLGGVTGLTGGGDGK